MFTDPPYNVWIDGNVGGLGSIKHREFAMASGEMTEVQYTNFLRTIFVNAVVVSLNGAIHFVCMDWRHMGETIAAGESVVPRTQEPMRLEQGQWGYGFVLSLEARTSHLSTRLGRRLTSTRSNSAIVDAIELMSGTMPG